MLQEKLTSLLHTRETFVASLMAGVLCMTLGNQALNGQCTNAPDLVIVNAHVITMNPAQPEATALAIRDGLIQAVGEDDQIISLVPQDCPVRWIDAGGRTILPGFNDAHCHWLSWREHLCDAPGQEETTYPELATVMDTLTAHGWTSISELNFGRPDVIPEHLQHAMELEANGDLHVRVNGYWGTYNAPDLIDVLQNYGYEPGHVFSERIRTPGVKMYIDDPFGTMDIMDQATCTALVSKAHQAGYQVAAHCVNVSAVEKILSAYESALGSNNNSASRHRIEHAVKVNDDQFQRMENKGIVASFQLLGPPDWPEQNTFQTYISNSNTNFILRWKDFIQSNIPVVGSTDAPFNNSVCQYSPFRAIYQAVTRKGYIDRMHAQWELDQRISIEDGLKLLTIDGAWVTKEESVKGSLEVGKYADLTIVSADPLSVADAEDLLDIRSEMTMVGGQVEYCASGFPLYCAPPVAFRVDTMIVLVSNYADDETPGSAFDGDEDTHWGAGDYPPQFLKIDFGKNTRFDRIECVVAQFPDGFTLHRLSGALDGAELNDLHTFGGVTHDQQVLAYDFENNNKEFRYLQMSTLQSPSWVAWKEIRLFREGSTSVDAPLSEDNLSVIAYPNPLKEELQIELTLPHAQDEVIVRLVHADGSIIEDVYSGALQAGQHAFTSGNQALMKMPGVCLLFVQSEDGFSVIKVVK